jgi:hypothetical protein
VDSWLTPSNFSRKAEAGGSGKGNLSDSALNTAGLT